MHTGRSRALGNVALMGLSLFTSGGAMAQNPPGFIDAGLAAGKNVAITLS